MSQNEPVPPRTTADRIGRIAMYLLLAVAIFAFPKYPAAELDASWRMVLGHALFSGWQFGKDIVFTYGPLGFAMGNTYYTGMTFWPLVVWHVGEALVFAALIYRLGMKLPLYPRAFYWVYMLLLGTIYIDALHMLIIAILGVDMLRREGETRMTRPLLIALALAVLSAVKFTNLMFAGFAVLVFAAHEVWRRRYGAAVRGLLWFAGGYLVVWVLCGQSPRNLPAYLLHSLQISSGYEQAMGIATPPGMLWKGLVVLGLMSSYLALSIFAGRDRPRSVAGGAVIAALLFLNWKHGFVRSDGHMIGFFICAMLPAMAYPALLDDGVRWRFATRCILIPAAILAALSVEFAIPSTLRHSLGIFEDRVHNRLDEWWHIERTEESYHLALDGQKDLNHLGAVRKQVGNATVDVMGHQQAIALYNKLNYQPRPVIQSYSAYSLPLDRLNYDYLASNRAPAYLLVQYDTLDGRLTAFDDAWAWRLIAHRYHYVLTEKGYQLWQRDPAAYDTANDAVTPLLAKTLSIGEPLDLSAVSRQPLWMEVDVKPTLLGRLLAFLYKPAFVQLQLTDTRGNTSTYHMPVPMGHAGFILNPIADNLLNYLDFAANRDGRRIKSVAVAIADDDRRYYSPTVDVRIGTMAPAHGADPFFTAQMRARFTAFKAVPITFHAHTPPSNEMVDGRHVTVMHAPSEMVFEVPKGATTLRGAFGYMPGAYTNGGKTDGADFIVSWSNGGAPRELMHRYLDPLNVTDDRGFHDFEVTLPQAPDGRVTLTITIGKANNGWDWTAWSGIEFK